MQKIEVYWRDIPAQILVKSGRVRGKAMLSHRFQAAIDRAAMRAGKGGSDEYLEERKKSRLLGKLNQCISLSSRRFVSGYVRWYCNLGNFENVRENGDSFREKFAERDRLVG